MPHRQRVPFTLATQAIPPISMRPDNTALLIQDMQLNMVDPKYGLGQVAEERGILVEFDPYYAQVQKVISNIVRLKERMTAAGMPTIYTRLTHDSMYGMRPSRFQRALGLMAGVGDEDSQIVSDLEPGHEDIVLLKRGFDAFNDTELEELLQEMRIDNLVLAGVITEFGIRSSAATAQDLGFHALVLSDGTASMTYETQSRTIGEICYGLTKVRSVGELMTYLDEMEASDIKII